GYMARHSPRVIGLNSATAGLPRPRLIPATSPWASSYRRDELASAGVLAAASGGICESNLKDQGSSRARAAKGVLSKSRASTIPAGYPGSDKIIRVCAV